MATKNAQVTVGTTATLLVAGDADGQFVALNNISAQDVYVGDSGVTTANGYKVATGTDLPVMPLPSGETLYGIVAATTSVVCVLRTGAT